MVTVEIILSAWASVMVQAELYWNWYLFGNIQGSIKWCIYLINHEQHELAAMMFLLQTAQGYNKNGQEDCFLISVTQTKYTIVCGWMEERKWKRNGFGVVLITLYIQLP